MGYGLDGQLGNGGTISSSVPGQASGLTGVAAIAGGGRNGHALRADGSVWAWRYGFEGQLGSGWAAHTSVPVQVSGLTGVAAIAGGGRNAYALRSDGSVWAWGWNTAGQLGNGGTASSSVPAQVSGLTGVTAIAGDGGDGYVLCPAPGLMEALNPREDESRGSTEEVPRRASGKGNSAGGRCSA